MSDLPSGTVTFLFTDIEGSTACWEHDHQAMAVAIKRYIVLLDAAIYAGGGLHADGLPVTSAACHRGAAWWSVNSLGGSNSSAGSANFA
jgi:class 3 adenylate cyclase